MKQINLPTMSITKTEPDIGVAICYKEEYYDGDKILVAETYVEVLGQDGYKSKQVVFEMDSHDMLMIADVSADEIIYLMEDQVEHLEKFLETYRIRKALLKENKKQNER